MSTDAEWRANAEKLVTRLAALPVEFTADDLRFLGLDEPAVPNRWGGLFSAMKTRGVIRPVGFGTALKTSRHHSVRRIWIGVTR